MPLTSAPAPIVDWTSASTCPQTAPAGIESRARPARRASGTGSSHSPPEPGRQAAAQVHAADRAALADEVAAAALAPALDDDEPVVGQHLERDRPLLRDLVAIHAAQLGQRLVREGGVGDQPVALDGHD